jgi:hypothetical protein
LRRSTEPAPESGQTRTDANDPLEMWHDLQGAMRLGLASACGTLGDGIEGLAQGPLRPWADSAAWHELTINWRHQAVRQRNFGLTRTTAAEGYVALCFKS